MAHTVKTKIIENGKRNVVLAVYLESDGASADLNNEVLLKPSDVGLDDSGRFNIQCVLYNFSGFDGVLDFDTGLATPNFKWVLTERANAPVDFRPFGGLKDDSPVPDGTGELRISTKGFSDAGDKGSILLHLTKH